MLVSSKIRLNSRKCVTRQNLVEPKIFDTVVLKCSWQANNWAAVFLSSNATKPDLQLSRRTKETIDFLDLLPRKKRSP